MWVTALSAQANSLQRGFTDKALISLENFLGTHLEWMKEPAMLFFNQECFMMVTLTFPDSKAVPDDKGRPLFPAGRE